MPFVAINNSIRFGPPMIGNAKFTKHEIEHKINRQLRNYDSTWIFSFQIPVNLLILQNHHWSFEYSNLCETLQLKQNNYMILTQHTQHTRTKTKPLTSTLYQNYSHTIIDCNFWLKSSNFFSTKSYLFDPSPNHQTTKHLTKTNSKCTKNEWQTKISSPITLVSELGGNLFLSKTPSEDSGGSPVPLTPNIQHQDSGSHSTPG